MLGTAGTAGINLSTITSDYTFFNSNNVGIGITAPTAKLDVNGQLKSLAGFSAYVNDGVWGSTALPQIVGLPNGGEIRLGYYSNGGGNYAGVIAFNNNGNTKHMSIGTEPGNEDHILFSNSSERMRITNSGNVGIGTTSPTAKLHLPAGAAAASSAPLKLTSGTNLTTPEAGAIEYDGTEFYATPASATRYIIPKTLKGSATLDFPSTATMAVSDLTITVTGAADGDAVFLGVPNASTLASGSFSAWVSAANTVTVRFANNSGGALDPASGTFKVTVNK